MLSRNAPTSHAPCVHSPNNQIGRSVCFGRSARSAWHGLFWPDPAPAATQTQACAEKNIPALLTDSSAIQSNHYLNQFLASLIAAGAPPCLPDLGFPSPPPPPSHATHNHSTLPRATH